MDLSAQTRRDAAHKAYWKEPSNEALLKEFDEAQKSWDVAYQTWLNSMVRELLAPDNTQSKTDPKADTPPALVEAPASEPKAKRRTIWDVVTPYIVEIMRPGQYATAKQLFNVLEAKAGPDSPFERGTGPHRSKLYIPEIHQTMAYSTLKNQWLTLLTKAKQ